MAAPSISTQVKRCLELNTSLYDAVADTDISLPDGLPLSLEDQKNRFAVWCGNIGAHRTGTSSLEHRLRDASHIKENVISLLDELESLTNDAKAIITGEMTPWDQMLEEEGEADDIAPDMPGTEMEQIAMDIKEVVDSLLRLSITIRNPAPHDRFLMSGSTDTSHFEAFDIQHVQAKFENAGSWLTERLGKAISRRRQYFKYRQQHHDKLAYGMDGDDDHGVAPSTLASSIPEKLKKGNQGLLDEDNDSNADWVSQTSFATSVGGSEQLHVPPLPEEAEKGPFECPFCFMIVNITDRKAWKKHIFADLRPYVCLEQDCINPDQEFGRRHEWLEHMQQNHWTRYSCPLGCQSPTFTSAGHCKAHLGSAHHGKVQEHQVDALIKLHAELKTDNINFTCSLCKHSFSSLKPFRRHVGRHQEQLSLFALPSVDAENGVDQQDDDLDSVSVGSGGSETGIEHVNVFDFLVATAQVPGEEMPIKLEDAPTQPDSEPTQDDTNRLDERQRVGKRRRTEDDIMSESNANLETDGQERDRDENDRVTTSKGSSVSASSSNMPPTTWTHSIQDATAPLLGMVHDHSQNRRSSVGSTSRPPVIVTTTQKDRLPATSTLPEPDHYGAVEDGPVPERHNFDEEVVNIAAPSATKARPEDPDVKSNESQWWRCNEPACDRMFVSYRGLWEHLKYAHNERKAQPSDRSRSDGDPVADLGGGDLRQPPEPDPEKIRLEAEVAAFKKVQEEANAAEKQREIEAQTRKDAEALFRRRMEDRRKAEEEAQKKIEAARIEAERAARERAEVEMEAEEEMQNAYNESIQRAEPNKDAKDRERAEDATTLRPEKALKAEAKAKVEAREALERYKQQDVERMAAKERELEELEQEYRRRMQDDLIKSGLDEREIAAILKGKKIEAPSEPASAERPRPTYTRMARRHLSIETLRAFRIDYEQDTDPAYLLIKRWVPEWEQDQLWNHTRTLRFKRSKQLMVEPQEQASGASRRFRA